MKKKKILKLILTLALTGSILGGCAKKESSDSVDNFANEENTEASANNEVQKEDTSDAAVEDTTEVTEVEDDIEMEEDSTNDASVSDSKESTDESAVESSQEPSDEENEIEEGSMGELNGSSISEISADMAIKLLKSSDLKENVLVSPSSVLMCLGMTMNGADGSTKSEMESVLCGGISTDIFNAEMGEVITKLNSEEDVKWNVANSIWVNSQDDIIQDSFKDIVVENYKADIISRPFDTSIATEVNNWVRNNTDGMIDSIMDETPQNTMMMLINAIAFDGKWEDPYTDDDISYEETFTDINGKEKKPAMILDTVHSYIEYNGGKGFAIDYTGGKYSYVGLLPEEGTSVNDYIASMDGSSFVKAYNDRTDDTVDIMFPEYDTDYSSSLDNALKNLGIKEAFSTGADFTAFTGDENDFYIGTVLHKTHIEVNREGTKAAAATSAMVLTSAYNPNAEIKQVYLNRPFVYAVVEKETGMPVFMGALNTVE
ncbi:MAG: hypothetical protein K6B41_11060 [Butyrivibrio sp.]|nr:hypothetical protein [Butyrivibrio sp.]